MKEWLKKANNFSDAKQDTISKLSGIIQEQAKLINQYADVTKSNNNTGVSCCIITKTFNQSFTVMKNNFGAVNLEAKMNVFAFATFFLTNPNVNNNLCKDCVDYLRELSNIFEEIRRQIALNKSTIQPNTNKTTSTHSSNNNHSRPQQKPSNNQQVPEVPK
jgi:hypothetical protein